MVINSRVQLTSKGHCDIADITQLVAREIGESPISNGIVTVFVAGSTAGITTIENEGGLLHDFHDFWDRIAPVNIGYAHDRAWGDGNGHSHVRASLLGPSLTIPFVDSRMTLGTWQQIVFVDFDNRPRTRDVVIQIIGE